VGHEPIWTPSPDEVAATGVSHFARWLTRAGRTLEIPVKRILQGADPRLVMEAGAVDDPGALRRFAAYQTRTSVS
jgi:acetoacetyl-CoA synthetase